MNPKVNIWAGQDLETLEKLIWISAIIIIITAWFLWFTNPKAGLYEACLELIEFFHKGEEPR